MAEHEYPMEDEMTDAGRIEALEAENARLRAENEWLRDQRDLAIETAEVSQAGWQAAVDELTRVSRAFAAAMKGTDA